MGRTHTSEGSAVAALPGPWAQKMRTFWRLAGRSKLLVLAPIPEIFDFSPANVLFHTNEVSFHTWLLQKLVAPPPLLQKVLMDELLDIRSTANDVIANDVM